MDQAPQDVTILLGEAAEGDQQAVTELLLLVYAELRLASGYTNRERSDHTLQRTVLNQRWESATRSMKSGLASAKRRQKMRTLFVYEIRLVNWCRLMGEMLPVCSSRFTTP